MTGRPSTRERRSTRSAIDSYNARIIAERNSLEGQIIDLYASHGLLIDPLKLQPISESGNVALHSFLQSAKQTLGIIRG